MERYEFIKKVGEGAFGTVARATNKQTGEVVAIKMLKQRYSSWEQCLSLREVKSLQKLNHPNIVKLKDLIHENDMLYFVFEFLDYNLYKIMKDNEKPFPESQVKKWCLEIFHGLAYMHQKGYFHRDLKPENFLVTKDYKIKIADLGLAREIEAYPPFTEYVGSRWYGAPEILLGLGLYGPQVDMWAMGVIIAELLCLRPLFPGTSDADQMAKICSVLGTPTEDSWADGLRLARDIRYQFPKSEGAPLPAILPSASDEAISLIRSLCSWDPSKRPTAAAALRHPFFQSCYYVPPHLRCQPTTAGAPREALKPERYQPPGKRRVDPSVSLVNEESCALAVSHESWSSMDWRVKSQPAFRFAKN